MPHTDTGLLCESTVREGSRAYSEHDRTDTSNPYWLSPLLSLTTHKTIACSDWLKNVRERHVLTRIAEASFGDVYRLSSRAGPKSDSEAHSVQSPDSVIKVIPLGATPDTTPLADPKAESSDAHGPDPSSPADVAAEVKILQHLSGVPGFATFRSLRLVRGRLPRLLKDSPPQTNVAEISMQGEPDLEIDCPFSALLEMECCGTDLESLVGRAQFKDVWPVYDVFWQVVFALARGESVAEFEHRDLHLGNICISGDYDSRVSSDDGSTRAHERLGFTGLQATLIDYTLSRARLEASTSSGVAYTDLSLQDCIFAGSSSLAYQYDIYRQMRSALYFSDPNRLLSELDDNALTKAHRDTGRSWAQFHPLTNVVWLHYVLHVLLSQMAWPSDQPLLPMVSEAEEKKEISNRNRAVALEDILLEVQDLLDPSLLGGPANRLFSASDLAAYAVQQGWIDEGGCPLHFDMKAREFDHIARISIDALSRKVGHLCINERTKTLSNNP